MGFLLGTIKKLCSCRQMKFIVLLTLTLVTLVTSLAPSLWGWDILDSNYVYDEGLPRPRQLSTDSYSACGRMTGDEAGFACPHMLMFSSDMLLAARHDGLDGSFLYAVAGSSTDTECGKCYQVRPLSPQRTDNFLGLQLILQVFNSGNDISPGHFDVYMGGGGLGYYSACNSDCRTRFCSGGPCALPLYDGNFDDWNANSSCYGGGISVLREKGDDELFELCRRLTGSVSSYKNQALWQSCFFTNSKLYHQNFVDADSVAVQCPIGLTTLTGLRRSDDDHLPRPQLGNDLNQGCRGDPGRGVYCITSMQDCCKPSCGWMDKGSPDPVWARVDTCNVLGFVLDYD